MVFVLTISDKQAESASEKYMPTSQTMERNKINQNYEILTELFGYDCKKVKYYHKAVTRKNPFICFYKC